MKEKLIYKNKYTCKNVMSDNNITQNYSRILYQGLNCYNYQAYKELEYKAWYSGDSALIRAFYRYVPCANGVLISGKEYFWKTSHDVAMVHLPIASSISEVMSSILFSELPEITTPKKGEQKLLDEILESNDLSHLLQRGSQLESYSGTIAGKISIDSDFEYPIIQWYSSEDIELLTKYDRVIEVCFKDKFIEDEEEYILKSYYGKGYIRYKVFNSKDEEIELSKTETYKDIKDILVVGKDGKPIKELMCVWKVNRVSNNVFDTSKGSSDYEGLCDIFDSIDETASTSVDIVKKSRPITVIPENLMQQDDQGNLVPINAYGVDYVSLAGSPDDNNEMPKRDFFQIQLQPYIEFIRMLIKTAINRVGISPSSFGIDDSGANASGEALNIRDRGTARTYSDKTKLWEETLIKLCRLMFLYNGLKQEKASEIEETYVYKINEDVYNKKISVVFPDYKEQTIKGIMEDYDLIFDNGLVSREYLIDTLFKDKMTDKELDEMKAELGIGDAENNDQSSQETDKEEMVTEDLKLGEENERRNEDESS